MPFHGRLSGAAGTKPHMPKHSSFGISQVDNLCRSPLQFESSTTGSNSTGHRPLLPDISTVSGPGGTARNFPLPLAGVVDPSSCSFESTEFA